MSELGLMSSLQQGRLRMEQQLTLKFGKLFRSSRLFMEAT